MGLSSPVFSPFPGLGEWGASFVGRLLHLTGREQESAGSPGTDELLPASRRPAVGRSPSSGSVFKILNAGGCTAASFDHPSGPAERDVWFSVSSRSLSGRALAGSCRGCLPGLSLHFLRPGRPSPIGVPRAVRDGSVSPLTGFKQAGQRIACLQRGLRPGH